VITASRRPDGELVLASSLPAGSTAFIDAEWIPSTGGTVAALVVDSDNTITRPDGSVEHGSSDSSPDEQAAAALVALAARATGAAGTSAVAVRGSGLLAEFVRQVGADAPPEPAAVVDTTGDPDTIAAVLRDLPDLGTLVLAGETLDRPLDLNLYTDVHSRGLRLVGAAWTAAAGASESDVSLLTDGLVDVEPGQALPPGALGYRLRA
jgi:hypothetical protein